MKSPARGLWVRSSCRSPKTRQTGGADFPHNSKNEKAYLQQRVESFEKNLKIKDFRLGGLGKSAKGCGEVIASELNIGEEEDGIYAIRYHPVDCLRIQCPRCYSRWALERTFAIVMRIEALALIKGERPFHVIFSVPPKDCSNWTWTNINDRLWKRGVRHLRRVRCNKAGERDHKIKECPECKNLSIQEYGGIGIFHPLRVKEKWKRRWNANPDPMDFEGLIDSGKFWKKIRYSIAHNLGSLSEYAKIGYHCHSWVFNAHPHKHKDKKFLVRYLEEGGSFKRFSRKEVIAFTRYLLTHTCVISEKTTYSAHECEHCGHVGVGGFRCNKCGREDFIRAVEVVRNRIVHPVRSFGMLLDFNPKKELIRKFGRQKGRLLYNLLAKEICSCLILEEVEDGENVTLGWNEQTEELEYPAYHRKSAPQDGENWISVWKVFDLLRDYDFTYRLSQEELDFLEDLADYLRTNGKPPPLKASSQVPCGNMFYVPPTVIVDAPNQEEFFGLNDFRLQEKVLRLVDRGETDIWRLDICIPDHKLGDILKVVNRLIGMNVIKDEDGDLSLAYVDTYVVGSREKEHRYACRSHGGLIGGEGKGGISDVSQEIVRLVASGVDSVNYLKGLFPTYSQKAFSTILDKLLEDGSVIKQPDGELMVGGKK